MEEYHALTETEQEVLVDLTVNILKKKIRELEDIRMSSARYLGLLQRIEDAADKVLAECILPSKGTFNGVLDTVKTFERMSVK